MRRHPIITATGVERTSLAEHTKFTNVGIYTATGNVNGEETEDNEQGAKEIANGWECDWIDNTKEGGK